MGPIELYYMIRPVKPEACRISYHYSRVLDEERFFAVLRADLKEKEKVNHWPECEIVKISLQEYLDNK